MISRCPSPPKVWQHSSWTHLQPLYPVWAPKFPREFRHTSVISNSLNLIPRAIWNGLSNHCQAVLILVARCYIFTSGNGKMYLRMGEWRHWQSLGVKLGDNWFPWTSIVGGGKLVGVKTLATLLPRLAPVWIGLRLRGNAINMVLDLPNYGLIHGNENTATISSYYTRQWKPIAPVCRGHRDVHVLSPPLWTWHF